MTFRKISSILTRVVPVCAFVLIMLFCARAQALTLTATHSTPTCAEPMTFTLSSDGTDCRYAMTAVYRYYTDTCTPELEVDPSKGSYKTTYGTDTTFSFQFRSSGTYKVCFGVFDQGVATPYPSTYTEVEFTINESAYPSAEAIVGSVAAQCKQACSSEFDRALWLHDWLVNNSDYDYSYSYCSANAALTGNKGTCESYHRAYVMLLDRVGIESSRVEGNGHVWTGVKIDGKWCQVDVTWDDMGNNYSGTYWEHLYFGLTDELMRAAHSAHTVDPSRPCTTLDNNYFIRTGKSSQWTDALFSSMSCNAGTVGTAQLTGTFSASSLPPSTQAIIYPIVAEALRRDTAHDVRAVSYDSSTGSFTCCFDSSNHLPNGTKTIASEAFANNGMSAIILPSGVETIGSCAFANSALQWIDIPDSVTSIASDAFNGVSGLTVICGADSYAYTYAQNNGFTVITR